jgi:hypothetical protein
VALFKVPKKTKEEKLAKLSSAQRAELDSIELNTIAEYQGDLPELESALGMLRMGYHFGWKVLYIIHSKRTIRKYEETLGIKIRDLFPAEGPSSYRSHGFRLAQAASNFWKVVSGDAQDVQIDKEDRQRIES